MNCPFFYENEKRIKVLKVKDKSIKRENGNQLFEFCLSY